VAIGDYDNDGYDDIFITSYNHNHLFHNEHGTGKFREVTHEMGLAKVHSTGYATSAAFGDYDNDCRLDLYVCYYCPWTLATDHACHDANGRLDYCSPDVYGKDTHVLYHNEGNRFMDVSHGAGYDHSGHESLFVTNFRDMPNMLFKNTGQGYVEDKSVFSHVGPLHQPYLTFGCEFIDYDADGWPDILTANGHVNIRGEEYTSMKEAKQLLHNDGDGTFSEVRAPVKLDDLSRPTIACGLAVGDFDNDGRLDVLFSNNSEAPQLLRNLDHSPHHWVSFKTISTKSNRDGLHARFLLTLGGKLRVASVRAGSSYLSVSDRRVYFGLGDATTIDKLEVLWPSGTRDELKDVVPDHSYVVTEGKGITGQLPERGETPPSPLHVASNRLPAPH
jgi:enediyne biosynthesis protein E4